MFQFTHNSQRTGASGDANPQRRGDAALSPSNGSTSGMAVENSDADSPRDTRTPGEVAIAQADGAP